MTTPHLQVPNVPPRIQYTANGAQTVFIFPFPVFSHQQLQVYVDQVLQTTSYAMQGIGVTTGGHVTFSHPPANGTVVTLERRIPLQRMGDFNEGGELGAHMLNTEFDLLMMCAQQLKFDQNAMLQFDSADRYDHVTLPNKNARAQKVLGFDSNGNPAMYETGDTYTSPSVTQSGIGAIARSITEKMTDAISVFDFGATGDGIADDTGAIQNALNAHDNVYMPPGTYRITESLIMRDNKHLSGTGLTSLLQAATDDFDVISITGSHNHLHDIHIQGGETGLRLYGADAPCHSNRISGLFLRGQNIAIELDGYTNINNTCAYNRFADIVIEKPATHGVLITRSGMGDYPNGNNFTNVAVRSLDMDTAGAGFFFEAARFNNTLTQCESSMAGTATACFHIGPESDKALLINVFANGSNNVPNILLSNGSLETSIVNLYSNSDGAAIHDLSGGQYLAFNAGYPEKTRLNRTHISDLSLDLQRFISETVAFSSPNTVSVDLRKTVYFINAANAVTTVELPEAIPAHNGAMVTIKKTDASENAVIITEDNGNGPDGRSLTLGSQYDTATMICDGAQWLILSSNILSYNARYVSGVTLYEPDITRRLHVISASAATTVRLPPANNALSRGRIVTIKKIDASANTVTVTEQGGAGPDNGNVVLSTRYAHVTIMSDGAAWHVIGK